MTRIIALAALLFISTISMAQVSQDEKATALIEKFVQETNVPGLAATVYKGGEII